MSSNLATFQTHTAKTGGTSWSLNLADKSLWTSLIRSPLSQTPKFLKSKFTRPDNYLFDVTNRAKFYPDRLTAQSLQI